MRHTLTHTICVYPLRPLFPPAFLATRLMRAHHISIIWWEVDLIDSHIGVPHLSMPRRQSTLLVFEYARLVPFVAPNVVGLFLANPWRAFRIRKFKNNKNKMACGAKILFILQNKDLIWCASIFRSKYSTNGHICILACRMYQIRTNYAKSVPFFLVIKGKIRGNWPLYFM